MASSRTDSPLLFDLPLRPDFSIEQALIKQGFHHIAGVDEAGRGPLAGPVVAAAVILDPDNIPPGLDDSKRLGAPARIRIARTIFDAALAVSVVSLAAETVDRINVLRASLEAMRRAVDALCLIPHHVLADGRDIPPDLPCPCSQVIKGDQRSQSIAAASIIAKVTRDRMMARTGECFSDYGFEKHAGYATARHKQAIAAHGPVERLHRLSFSPLAGVKR